MPLKCQGFSGDLRATLGWIVDDAGEPRLVTQSGLCTVDTLEALRKKAHDEAPVVRRPDGREVCDVDAAQCYALALNVEGGERYLFLKKACRLGHRQACDAAIELATSVQDKAGLQELQQLHNRSSPGATSAPADKPAPPPATPGKRRPLGT